MFVVMVCGISRSMWLTVRCLWTTAVQLLPQVQHSDAIHFWIIPPFMHQGEFSINECYRCVVMVCCRGSSMMWQCSWLNGQYLDLPVFLCVVVACVIVVRLYGTVYRGPFSVAVLIGSHCLVTVFEASSITHMTDPFKTKTSICYFKNSD